MAIDIIQEFIVPSFVSNVFARLRADACHSLGNLPTIPRQGFKSP